MTPSTHPHLALPTSTSRLRGRDASAAFLAVLAIAAVPACASTPTAPAEARVTGVVARLEESERRARAGDLAEAEAVLHPALRAGPSTLHRARLLLQLGRVRGRMAWFWDLRPDLAERPTREALALAERAGDPDLRAETIDAATMIDYTGLLFRGEGTWPPIEARFAEALALARDPAIQARVRFHIALAHQMQGRLDQAGRELDASLALARAAGDDDTAHQDLRHLAAVASMRGDRARAIALHTESLALRKKIGDQIGVATAHLAIAQLEVEAGDDIAARGHLEPANEIAVRLGLGYPQIEAAAGLARLEVRAGAAAKAEPLARRAVAIARSRRGDAALGQALLAVVEVEAALGRAGRARAALAEARGAAGRAKDADLEAECAAIARRLDSR